MSKKYHEAKLMLFEKKTQILMKEKKHIKEIFYAGDNPNHMKKVISLRD